MATARRPIARLTAISALALAGLTLIAAPAGADPTTQPEAPSSASEAVQQIVELQHDLEAVTEQFNGAEVVLAAKEAELAQAKDARAIVDEQLTGLQDQVSQLAAGAYKGDNMTGFSSFMTSTSPQEFLDKINTIELISAHNNETLAALTAAQNEATRLQKVADEAFAAAQQTEQALAEKKTYIEAELPKLETQLAQLTAEETAQVQSAEFTSSEPTESETLALSAPTGAPAASGAAGVAVQAAYSKLGAPYVWAAEGPDSFDCSGLTSWAYNQAGIAIPRTADAQAGAGTPVSRSEVSAGDLVFFYSPISHVGIAINNTQMIHAPTSGDVVKVADIDSNPSYSGATRVG